MDFWLNFRLKLRDFFTKYRLIIIIAVIVIAIIFMISFAIGNRVAIQKAKEDAVNNFQVPVIDTNEELPAGYNDEINEIISNYFSYCNAKKYEEAYELLSKDFKNVYFKDISKFKQYIDIVFKSKRMYSTQNYSNVDGIYVFNVRIMDDLLATGTTDNYEYLEDKFVITDEEGELKLALNGYCKTENLNVIAEDEYIKVRVLTKKVLYDREVYTVEFTNKTKNYIVLANGEEKQEICLELKGETIVADTTEDNIYISPNKKITRQIEFDKYLDNNKEPEKLILNAIRVLPEYTDDLSNIEKEMKNAIKLYSRTINLKQIDENEETSEA